MDKIKIHNNVTTSDEVTRYVDYINQNISHFKKDTSSPGPRYAQLFGFDNFNKDNLTDVEELRTNHPHLAASLNRLLAQVNEAASAFYRERVFVSIAWFAKQEPGAIVPGHYDSEAGTNEHIKYSAVLYLNDLKSDGQLLINNSFVYTPAAGDLVTFPTEGYWHEVPKIGADRYSIAMWLTTDPNFQLTF